MLKGIGDPIALRCGCRVRVTPSPLAAERHWRPPYPTRCRVGMHDPESTRCRAEGPGGPRVGSVPEDRPVGCPGREAAGASKALETINNTQHLLGSDHPHAGGENDRDARSASTGRGPSPRGWGKPLVGSHVLDLYRAIPTRVGKTILHFLVVAQAAGHPHAGGENARHGRSLMIPNGPSPRGWSVDHQRAIPTRVGKTGAAA